jgi:hypothetical protein
MRARSSASLRQNSGVSVVFFLFAIEHLPFRQLFHVPSVNERVRGDKMADRDMTDP